MAVLYCKQLFTGSASQNANYSLEGNKTDDDYDDDYNNGDTQTNRQRFALTSLSSANGRVVRPVTISVCRRSATLSNIIGEHKQTEIGVKFRPVDRASPVATTQFVVVDEVADKEPQTIGSRQRLGETRKYVRKFWGNERFVERDNDLEI